MALLEGRLRAIVSHGSKLGDNVRVFLDVAAEVHRCKVHRRFQRGFAVSVRYVYAECAFISCDVFLSFVHINEEKMFASEKR